MSLSYILNMQIGVALLCGTFLSCGLSKVIKVSLSYILNMQIGDKLNGRRYTQLTSCHGKCN